MPPEFIDSDAVNVNVSVFAIELPAGAFTTIVLGDVETDAVPEPSDAYAE
jgi:hypothetical protein